MNKVYILIIVLFSLSIVNAQENNYSIKNVSINTSFQDFGVSFFGNSEVVFASSRKIKTIRNRTWQGNAQPFLELFRGTIDEQGEISDVNPFSSTINTRYHESNVCFTKDLKTVYFSRDNYLNKKAKKDKNGLVLIQLYKANVTNTGEWENIESLPFNSDNFDSGHPVLNKAEDKMYFTSNRPGSFGLTDIYVVDIHEDGSFGEPKNLGPEVNTSNREMFPYIDANGILYFSSDGFNDISGGLDIYATKITNGEVTEKAQNLGQPINSVMDDFGLVFKENQNVGYFSSNREGGKGDDDIYFFTQLNPIKFECNQHIEGEVRDKENNALLPGALVTLFDGEGNKIESIIADKFGQFGFEAACDASYIVLGKKDGYNEAKESFNTTDEKGVSVALTLVLEQNEFISVGGQLMVNINPIYFDLDKSLIRPDAAIELEKVVQVMKKYPQLKIELGSHTDSRATDNYNLKLSDRRAKSSVKWIVGRGIDASRITGKGYGETKLVNDCSNGVKCTDGEHQLNRRTEFVIQNPEIIK